MDIFPISITAAAASPPPPPPPTPPPPPPPPIPPHVTPPHLPQNAPRRKISPDQDMMEQLGGAGEEEENDASGNGDRTMGERGRHRKDSESGLKTKDTTTHKRREGGDISGRMSEAKSGEKGKGSSDEDGSPNEDGGPSCTQPGTSTAWKNILTH